MRPVTLSPEGPSPNSRSESRARPQGASASNAGLAPDGGLLSPRSKPCGGGGQDFPPFAERPAAAAAANPEARGREEPGSRLMPFAQGRAWSCEHISKPGAGCARENGPCTHRLRAERPACLELSQRRQQLAAPSLQGTRPDPAGLDRRGPRVPFP